MGGCVDCCHDGVDGPQLVNVLASAVEVDVWRHVVWEVWVDVEEVAEGKEGVGSYCLLLVRALDDWGWVY